VQINPPSKQLIEFHADDPKIEVN